MQTLKQTLIIPGIVSIIFIVSCLVPFIQIIVMTVDGGLLSIINKIVFNDSEQKIGATNWLTNFSLSILFLFLYAISKTSLIQILFSTLSIIFLFCFIAFMSDKYSETDPYFLYFMITGLISSLVLCVFATIRHKLLTRQKVINNETV